MIGVLATLGQPLPVDPSPIDTPTVDWAAEAPLLVLVGGALLLMLASAFVRSRRSTVGPPAIIQPSLTCGSPSVFDAPPSVNDRTSARMARSLRGASISSA